MCQQRVEELGIPGLQRPATSQKERQEGGASPANCRHLLLAHPGSHGSVAGPGPGTLKTGLEVSC